MFFVFLSIVIFNLTICQLQAKDRGDDIETSVPKWVGSKAILLFQKYISPIDGARCNFYPSCSAYSQQCVKKWGLFRCIIMTADRLQRCHSCVSAENYPSYTHGRLWDPQDENNFW